MQITIIKKFKCTEVDKIINTSSFYMAGDEKFNGVEVKSLANNLTC
jgi:hypothetical protein